MSETPEMQAARALQIATFSGTAEEKERQAAAIIREKATGPLHAENKTLRELLERAVPHMKSYSGICKISRYNVQDWLARAAEVLKEHQ